MIYNERECRHEHLLTVVKQMMTAARTAPKGKGVDIIEVVTLDGEDIKRLSSEMIEMFEEYGLKFLLRDADNILSAEYLVLIGTRDQMQGLNCGYCGFATCQERGALVPCAINAVDVGIAIGSACATAADCRVDTRVLFSAGAAAERLGCYLPGCRQIYGIAVSASSKNPFFDRKPKE
ncbi:MAG: DUF2148 domain-containing protein [Rikenellaceae bacterium]